MGSCDEFKQGVLVLRNILQDVIEKAEKKPNLTIGILISITVVLFTLFIRILFGGKKPEVSLSALYIQFLFSDYIYI